LSAFATCYIPPLDDQEANALICQTNEELGQRIPVQEMLQQEIRDKTGGQPYLIQLLCSRLYGEGTLRPIISPDSDLAVDSLLASNFQNDYNALSPLERVIIHKLAEDNGKDIESLGRVIGIERWQIERHLYFLEGLGYSRCDNGKYRIANDFLRRWLSEPVLETPREVSDRASRESATRSTWDTATIRKLLTDALSEQELVALAFDRFRQVHEQFGDEMSKPKRIQRLLDHCVRRGQLARLLDWVAQDYPEQYEHFASQLRPPF